MIGHRDYHAVSVIHLYTLDLTLQFPPFGQADSTMIEMTFTPPEATHESFPLLLFFWSLLVNADFSFFLSGDKCLGEIVNWMGALSSTSPTS